MLEAFVALGCQWLGKLTVPLALILRGKHKAAVVEQAQVAFFVLQFRVGYEADYGVDGTLPQAGFLMKTRAGDGGAAGAVDENHRLAFEICHARLLKQEAECHFPVVPHRQGGVPPTSLCEEIAAHDVPLRGKKTLENVIGENVAFEVRLHGFFAVFVD